MKIKSITNHAVHRFRQRAGKGLVDKLSDNQIRGIIKNSFEHTDSYTVLQVKNPSDNYSRDLVTEINITDKEGHDFGRHKIILKKDIKNGQESDCSVITFC